MYAYVYTPYFSYISEMARVTVVNKSWIDPLYYKLDRFRIPTFAENPAALNRSRTRDGIVNRN